MQISDTNNSLSDIHISYSYGSGNYEKKIEFEQPKSTPVSEDLGRISSILADGDITLKFTRDSPSSEMVVELIDSKTGEAIRQIPSEVSLRLAAYFVNLQGRFVNQYF